MNALAITTEGAIRIQPQKGNKRNCIQLGVSFLFFVNNYIESLARVNIYFSLVS